MDFLLNKAGEHLVDNISLDRKMNDLKRKLEHLNALKEDTKSKLMAAELQPRKKRKEQVRVWLEHVEKINGEVQSLDQQIAESSTLSRGFRTEKVLEKVREVENLIQLGQFDQGVVADDLTWIGQSLSTTNLVGNAAEICMKEIWTCLMNDDIAKVGVWGMGGLGKTTIMKIIHNQLLKETQKFNIVIWTTVSKEMNIFKIQEGISRAIGVTLPEDEPQRAGMLSEILTTKGKYVLILDDLWSKLSLEAVGIPEPSMGSKLVVTTRKLDVCHYLDCQEVRMPILPKEDAWNLFLEKVGRDVLGNENLLPIVESVVEQCAGLPLAVVTVASSMKGKKTIHEWRNALNELSTRAKGETELDKRVLQQLQFSYDHLQDERLQHCFLCCALYPEDYNIPDLDLINLWINEGLIEEMDSEQTEIDKGYDLLNKLKSNCLLEEGENWVKDTNFVKLHDLVRDMALHITSVRPHFLVRAGMQLRKMPHVREWAEDLEKVSLMYNYRLEIPSQMSAPSCKSLTTLLLSGCSIEDIPDLFFGQMPSLKVLDLSENDIKELPSSISNLETLTVLLLRNCCELEEVPSLQKLEVLKKLDLKGTRITNLPDGMERLVKLNYLCADVEKLPSGVFSKLSCMRHLVVRKAFFEVQEIGELEKLEVFEGRFHYLNELNTFVQALGARGQQLSRYFIRVGDQIGDIFFDGEKYDGKCIDIYDCEISRNGVKLPSDVEELRLYNMVCSHEEDALFSRFVPKPNGMFSSLEKLEIGNCEKMKKLFPWSWVLRNLQNLEELSVKGCGGLEEIFQEDGAGSSRSNSNQLTLPKLRILALDDLGELRRICGANRVLVCDSLEKIHIYYCPELERMPLYFPLLDYGQPSPPISLKEIRVFYPSEDLLSWLFIPTQNGKFSSLEILELQGCKNIRKLFSCSLVLRNLQNLEELRVDDCEELEELVEEDGTGSNSIQLTLPKLRLMRLGNLPELRSICGANGVLVCDSLEEIHIKICPKLERMPLYPPLLDDGQPRPPPPLKIISVCEAPLSWLFVPTPNAMFPSLEKLHINSCKDIRKLFSCNWVRRNLNNLDELIVYGCEGLEEIVEEDGLEEIVEEDGTGSNSIQLTLPKLRLMWLSNLPELRSIYGANGVLVCDSLQRIWILNCPKLERMPLHLPQLNDGQPSPPPFLTQICINPRELWESMKWDHPNAKSLLQPLLSFRSF